MSEATSTAAAGVALGLGPTGAAPLTIGNFAQVVAVFFVAMGLQPEHLFAGMWGALAGISLLGNVPLEKDTFIGRINQGLQRVVVVVVCSVMAGYTTPFVAHLISAPFAAMGMNISEFRVPTQMFTAFVVGAGGRPLLEKFIKRYARTIDGGRISPPSGTH